MRGLRDAIVLGVVLLLQSTVLFRMEIAGVRPDLLVAFVVYLGWMRGPIAGTAGGFAIGLIQDLDAPGPLGLNALCKSLVGFLVAKAGFRVHRSNLGVRFAFFFLAMLLHDVIYFAVETSGNLGAFFLQMFRFGLPSAIYTGLIVLVILMVAERGSRWRLLADET
jgi:rod shape-determining protein MreD